MLPSSIFNVKPEQDMAILRTKTQWFLLLLGLVIIFTVPFYMDKYWLNLVPIYIGIFIVAVLGLHILTGLCGQFSIGHAAFMGVGAYTAAILAAKFGVSGWLTLPLSGLMAGLVGVVFGAPAVRIKGFYLAMSTLAAQFIIIWCFKNIDWIKGEGMITGWRLKPLTLGGITTHDDRAFYILLAVIVVVMIFFAKNLQRTKTGRVFIAIRDNEQAAEVMGINLFRYKLLAFFIGCFYAGIAGWMWAYSQEFIIYRDFQLEKSIWFIGMMVIGGMGSTTGAILGVGAVAVVDKVITTHYISNSISSYYPDLQGIFSSISLMVFAVLVIIFMIFEPRGLYHRWEVFKATYRIYPYSY